MAAKCHQGPSQALCQNREAVDLIERIAVAFSVAKYGFVKLKRL